jgi:antitoxin ParD1/3/4
MVQIQLPPELEAFVQLMLDGGQYASAEQVMRDALWLLKDQADMRTLKLAELRKQIAVGLEQAERGESAPLDMQTLQVEATRILQEQEQEADACPR